MRLSFRWACSRRFGIPGRQVPPKILLPLEWNFRSVRCERENTPRSIPGYEFVVTSSDAIIDVLIFAGRNDRLAALLVDEVMQSVGVAGTVSQHSFNRDASDQVASRDHVVLLAGAENGSDRGDRAAHTARIGISACRADADPPSPPDQSSGTTFP